MKQTEYRKIWLMLAGTIASIILFSAFVSTNPTLLRKLAGNFSSDSFIHDYSMKRIIKVYDRDSQKVIDLIAKNYNSKNSYFYVDTILLSIFADNRSLELLNNQIEKISNIEETIYTDSNVSLLVEAMGISMMTNKVTYLEKLLEELNKTNSKNNLSSPINYMVARSLFFITGEMYEYKSTNKDKTTVRITDDMLSVRDVLVKSAGRKRTDEEMTLLLRKLE